MEPHVYLKLTNIKPDISALLYDHKQFHYSHWTTRLFQGTYINFNFTNITLNLTN
jgi:hypothetical protein